MSVILQLDGSKRVELLYEGEKMCPAWSGQLNSYCIKERLLARLTITLPYGLASVLGCNCPLFISESEWVEKVFDFELVCFSTVGYKLISYYVWMLAGCPKESDYSISEDVFSSSVIVTYSGRNYHFSKDFFYMVNNECEDIECVGSIVNTDPVPALIVMTNEGEVTGYDFESGHAETLPITPIENLDYDPTRSGVIRVEKHPNRPLAIDWGGSAPPELSVRSFLAYDSANRICRFPVIDSLDLLTMFNSEYLPMWDSVVDGSSVLSIEIFSNGSRYTCFGKWPFCYRVVGIVDPIGCILKLMQFMKYICSARDREPYGTLYFNRKIEGTWRYGDLLLNRILTCFWFDMGLYSVAGLTICKLKSEWLQDVRVFDPRYFRCSRGCLQMLDSNMSIEYERLMRYSYVSKHNRYKVHNVMIMQIDDKYFDPCDLGYRVYRKQYLEKIKSPDEGELSIIGDVPNGEVYCGLEKVFSRIFALNQRGDFRVYRGGRYKRLYWVLTSDCYYNICGMNRIYRLANNVWDG